MQGLSLQYPIKHLRSNCAPNYKTWAANKSNLEKFYYKTENFKYSFFLFCVREWNNLGKSMCEAKSIKQFKPMCMEFFILKVTSLSSIHGRIGVKLLTRTRLKFSHWNEHKFHHKFRDCVSHIYNCGAEIETTKQFSLALLILC